MQSYFKEWDFEMKTYRETCAISDQIEHYERVYEGKTAYRKH